MNKYLIPICDLVNAEIWIEVISARSISNCQDKLMRQFSENLDEDFSDYHEFIKIMDEKYNYSVGSITDIETL